MKSYAVLFSSAQQSCITIEQLKKYKQENKAILTQLAEAITLFPHKPQHIFLEQTHSDRGSVIDKYQPSFVKEGDFLITNKPGLAISVLTADCLPLILYDKKQHACAIVHAGWRGSVQKIVQKTIHALQQAYGTNPAHIEALLGPHAQVCCYEVQRGFAQEFYDDVLEQSLKKRNAQLFFDNSAYTTQELIACGVPHSQISYEYAVCTICNEAYGSFRRLKEKSPLNISSICLSE